MGVHAIRAGSSVFTECMRGKHLMAFVLASI